jgi:hypothetical protein
MGSSVLSRWVYGGAPLPAGQCILVLPGSRSRPLAWKLKNDPRLNEVVGEGWRFLKLRHLRRLAVHQKMTLETWEELLKQDPPLWEGARQITMFA